jgi:Cytochrome P460
LVNVAHEAGDLNDFRVVLGNAVFGRDQSFVTGAPTNLEFMVKDSKKYATTAGWGFGQFTDGKPDDEAVHRACFSCHGPAKGHDFLFTRYAP